jgi:outer membrane protein assembly factor BamE (lipoprotein component of BamABCDE complex)
MTVYFNEDQTVSRIANYGLKDGKVFDYITRTTPTGGKDISFLSQLLGAAATAPIKPFGG